MITRKEREKNKLKLEIFDTVIQLAREHGWNEVSIRKISQKIEYSTMVIYNLFSSKEELFIEIKSYGFQNLHIQYKKVKITADDPKQSLLDISYATLDFFQSNRELYQIMFGVIGLSGVPDICEDGSYSLFAAEIVEDLLVKVLDGDKSTLFLNWWAIVHGFISIASTMDNDGINQLLPVFDAGIKRFLDS